MSRSTTEQRYIVDTSVLARATIDVVGDRLEALVMEGWLWTCRIIDLEIIYASRSRAVAEVIRERFALPEVPITPAVMDRATRVAGLLAKAGKHRGAKPIDLVIAASAEAYGLTVLHYDVDYDRIATVTHQSTEWAAPKGTLDF